ncbi:hypothetical protein PR001_g6881 [Phytophthora rubi]|uniref:Uncharacterized protein n=1 Tax=Phytophthora rubi TaxID=129364 RepID=A0A6A3NIM0_9STRA|nr:hypothetical protein PR001_g6881 [Phytophthora rubi]
MQQGRSHLHLPTMVIDVYGSGTDEPHHAKLPMGAIFMSLHNDIVEPERP